jgi:hypothetical protein
VSRERDWLIPAVGLGALVIAGAIAAYVFTHQQPAPAQRDVTADDAGLSAPPPPDASSP